ELLARETTWLLGSSTLVDAGSIRSRTDGATAGRDDDRPDHGGRGAEDESSMPSSRSRPVTLSASGRRHGWVGPPSVRPDRDASSSSEGSGSEAPASVSAAALKKVQLVRSSGGSGAGAGCRSD